MNLKSKIINEIIDIEGGYVNNPDDSGGPTNFGITQRVARKHGYSGDMQDMDRGVAYAIYEALYWDSLSLDHVAKISEEIAAELADTGVNMGVSRAAEFLQRSLNVLNQKGRLFKDMKVDGDIGPVTLRYLDFYVRHRGKAGTVVLLRMLNSLQGAKYIDLAEKREKDESFVFGWFLHRVS